MEERVGLNIGKEGDWGREMLSKNGCTGPIVSYRAQYSTAQHSTVQYSTAQHGTAQHSTAQHGTARCQRPPTCALSFSSSRAWRACSWSAWVSSFSLS